MLPASLERIVSGLDESARVLDVGGWARPLARADWVIDLMPYETRGLLGWDGARDAERFAEDRWVVRDICASEPWPFEDGQFDFAVCSHTLEDVRDPVRVCEELQRVARAGYIEVPSRLEEQSFGVAGEFVGWSHHRWLVDVGDREIQFVHKPHVIHARASDHFPVSFHRALTPEQRVSQLWWEGGFVARERVMTSPEELDPYLQGLVAAHRSSRTPPPRGLRGLARRLRGR